MKHEKRYVVKWMALLVLIVFVTGELTGYTIGIATASKRSNESSTPSTLSTTIEVVKSLPVEVTYETTEIAPIEVVEPVKVYYDCPLNYDLQDYIRELCEKNEIPMSLVIAMIEVESSFRTNVVSSTSDYGLMQINKINHEWLSKKYGITDFLDPYQNVLCGISIIAQHYHRYENVDKSLMAYNLGTTGAKRLWDKGVYETSYTRKIKTVMEVYENEI